MNSKRLSGAFACVLADLSEFVPSALLITRIEIPIPSRQRGTSNSLGFPKHNDLANKLRGGRFRDHKDDESSLKTSTVIPGAAAKVSLTYSVGQAHFAQVREKHAMNMRPDNCCQRGIHDS